MAEFILIWKPDGLNATGRAAAAGVRAGRMPVLGLRIASADVNAERRWRTHLGEFTTKGNLQAADLLIQHGADEGRMNTDWYEEAKASGSRQHDSYS